MKITRQLEKSIKKVNIFGCDIACINKEETINHIDWLVNNRVYTQHVVLNAGKVVLMEKDPRLKKIINGCSLINADGQSIVWASKFFKKPLPERVAGIDLMEDLIDLAENRKYKVFFFGAKEKIVKSCVEHYKKVNPALEIAGYRNGYFHKEDEASIVETIKNSNADILFVAFSSPQKEYWLSKYGEELNVPFVMGVGGSFDVIAGLTKRAPKIMQELGLEWFYRFLQEPRRMWKRYLVGNIKFLLIAMREKIKNN